ncbi:MAG: hypothetical protein Q4C95_03010 [Planctomycetia bacterium]|nr:hypothetical protein [Planctomycetia bacterium]
MNSFNNFDKSIDFIEKENQRNISPKRKESGVVSYSSFPLNSKATDINPQTKSSWRNESFKSGGQGHFSEASSLNQRNNSFDISSRPLESSIESAQRKSFNETNFSLNNPKRDEKIQRSNLSSSHLSSSYYTKKVEKTKKERRTHLKRKQSNNFLAFFKSFFLIFIVIVGTWAIYGVSLESHLSFWNSVFGSEINYIKQILEKQELQYYIPVQPKD